MAPMKHELARQLKGCQSMSQTRGWISRLLAVMVILAGLVPTLLVAPATSNAADDLLELFYSDRTGYFFFWDADTWSLVDAGTSSDPEGDWILLSDGEVDVDIWAIHAPGATTSECLGVAMDGFYADPSVLEIEDLSAEGGPPQIYEDVTNLVLTVDGLEGTEKFAVRLTCDEVVPGESLYLRSIFVPAALYNATGKEPWEYELDFFSFGRPYHPETESVPIPDDAGDVAATLTTHLPCDTATFSVLAQGAGGGSGVVIDPSSFIAIDDTGVSLPIAMTAWLLPGARPETSLSLRPGESGLMLGVVEAEPGQVFELYYNAPSGDVSFLARPVWGCGAGGGAPVLIDIE
jgi:hypothetical protein